MTGLDRQQIVEQYTEQHDQRIDGCHNAEVEIDREIRTETVHTGPVFAKAAMGSLEFAICRNCGWYSDPWRPTVLQQNGDLQNG